MWFFVFRCDHDFEYTDGGRIYFVTDPMLGPINLDVKNST